MADPFNLPSTRKHVPQLGRLSSVTLALLPTGLRPQPVKQILYIGGYYSNTKIVTAAEETYVNVVAGTNFSYAAGASDSKKKIAYELFKLINAGATGVSAENLRDDGSGNWMYDLYHPSTTFTNANTGSTTPSNIEVASVSGNTTEIAKGATSIALVNSVLGDIQPNQYLQAVDALGNEKLFQLSAIAEASDTSLSVNALNEAISAGSKVIFPVELYDRNQADTSESNNVQEFQTFNSGGRTDSVVTGTSATVALGGNFYEFCPAYNTLAYAVENGRECWLIIADPAVRDEWTRRTTEGAAKITGRTKARPVGGFVTNDLSGRFDGDVIETPAAPIV
jgi:hypothetical protein